MAQRKTVVRSRNDLGLAAWFGGTLADAVAVNGAAADVSDPNQPVTVVARSRASVDGCTSPTPGGPDGLRSTW